ncbi:MAG: hypothetical protein JWQ09_2638 [Segetibacter sp.]|nr:hypothetical protein [Segetibacter sp.]
MSLLTSLDQIIRDNASSLINWLVGLKLKEEISNEVKHAYGNKILEYQANMVKQFAETQTLLHKDLVPFLDIYQPLTIIGSESFQITRGITETLYSRFPMISIWGNAGNGKTTILKFLFIDCVLTNFKIPILLNLRDIEIEIDKKSKEPENLLYDYLLKHLKFYRVSELKKITNTMLEHGRFLILLDGYDETDFEKSAILNKQIYEFTSFYNRCAYLITSRFDSKAISLHSFKPFTIKPFDHFEIKSFIRKQFLTKSSRVDEIIATVFKEENKRYLEYLENPLFLILFLNSYDIYPNIPATKSRFFENVYEALYEKHDSFAKLGFNRKRYVELTKEVFEKVLFSFCFISYFSKRISFDKAYMSEVLESVKKHYSLTFQNDKYIKELKINLNLLVEERHNIKFLHLSLQEFFAAKFMSFLKEEEIRYLFTTLAQGEIKYGGNQFFLEIIAELYPHHFYDYYLPHHIKLYFETYKWAFQKGYYDSELFHTAMTRYISTRVIIEKNDVILDMFLIFLKKYSVDVQHSTFVSEFQNTANEKLAKEIKTLYHHHEQFLQMLSDYFENQVVVTKNILNIVFDKTSKISKPFGNLSLPSI